MMSNLKSLSDNSNISVTLVLTSIDCLLFVQFENFLVLDMMDDFWLNTHFVIM